MALPKYYAVRADKNHPRFEEFKRRFKELYNVDWGFGAFSYYGYDESAGNGGTNGGSLNIFKPGTVELTIDEFFAHIDGPEPKPFEPKIGDRALFWDTFKDKRERIFIGKHNNKYIVVTKDSEESFNNNSVFTATYYNNCEPLPEHIELTIDQIADKFGHPKEYITIKS